MNEFVVRYMAFNGVHDVICDAGAIAEITDLAPSGTVEVMFKADRMKGKPTLYIKLNLPELVAMVTKHALEVSE